MSKRLFNFYLDDSVKNKAVEKLERLCGTKEKGQLASFLRVCIVDFLNTPDEHIDKEFLAKIDKEYLYSSIKNKRSRL